MELIVEVLTAAYPDAVVTSGCHAVKIDFGDGGFTFDVVPAFEVGTSDVTSASPTWTAADGSCRTRGSSSRSFRTATRRATADGSGRRA